MWPLGVEEAFIWCLAAHTEEISLTRGMRAWRNARQACPSKLEISTRKCRQSTESNRDSCFYGLTAWPKSRGKSRGSAVIDFLLLQPISKHTGHPKRAERRLLPLSRLLAIDSSPKLRVDRLRGLIVRESAWGVIEGYVCLDSSIGIRQNLLN